MIRNHVKEIKQKPFHELLIIGTLTQVIGILLPQLQRFL